MGPLQMFHIKIDKAVIYKLPTNIDCCLIEVLLYKKINLASSKHFTSLDTRSLKHYFLSFITF